MTDIQETEIVARLRALAEADQPHTTSPQVRARVMKAWDTRAIGSLNRPRFSLRVWLPVTVALTMVVGLLVGSIRQEQRSPRTLTDSSGAGRADDVEPAMLAVPDASLLPRFDHGEFVPIEISTPSGPIQAEVLIGQDGFARAIRVIQ
jgi:hypothetical protein